MSPYWLLPNLEHVCVHVCLEMGRGRGGREAGRGLPEEAPLWPQPPGWRGCSLEGRVTRKVGPPVTGGFFSLNRDRRTESCRHCDHQLATDDLWDKSHRPRCPEHLGCAFISSWHVPWCVAGANANDLGRRLPAPRSRRIPTGGWTREGENEQESKNKNTGRRT